MNVTVPFKKLIIPFLDKLNPIAEKTESVNTVLKINNQIMGYNTDQPGFNLTVEELFPNNKIKSNNWFLNNSRSVGLIGAVEFGYEGSKKFDVKEKIAAKCAKIIQENGVILRALPGDIIGFCPPLIINESQLNEMFDKIEEAIKDFDQTAYSLK